MYSGLEKNSQDFKKYKKMYMDMFLDHYKRYLKEI